jgi:peptide/nickel transport system permease protein
LSVEPAHLVANPGRANPNVGLVVRMSRDGRIVASAAVLLVMIAMALAAPWLGTVSPSEINPAFRNRSPGAEQTLRLDDGTTATLRHWMGTDSLGRDLYSRVIYGARISLAVGISAAVVSSLIGLVIGLVSGYIRWADAIIMRFMDGLMAIPAILLALALVSLFRAGLATVIVAIVVPEVPNVVRLVRSIVLSVREEPYVEAAVMSGTPMRLLLIRHVLPNTMSPLIVQGTLICASAILVEAILSFLGVGLPPETPSWGNIMAEGRALFRVYPHIIFFPGIFVALTILAVNVLGDGLRDQLDPKLAKWS